MKKPFDHRAKDHKRCVVCNKNLKANLVHKIPDADMCFKHHMMRKGTNPSYPKDHLYKFYELNKKQIKIRNKNGTNSK